ncbi:MAG: alpha/beta fold hydrolase [Candidatus Azotimanducaceae bacterium]
METKWFSNGSIDLEVKLKGEGPLILCVHGWPELWYSWRHQMDYFASRGYKVAAMNVRGYGGSSHPSDIESYTIKNLASDVAAVAVGLSKTPVILFGPRLGRSNRLPNSHTLSGSILCSSRSKRSLPSHVRTIVS